MSSYPTSSKFYHSVLASKLVSRKDLKRVDQELRAEYSEVNDQHLAQRLIEKGWLNAWQVSQLLEGRTRFTLSHYRIVDALGQGAEGQVFLAERFPNRSPVAIKVLPLEKATVTKIARFKREIEIQSRLEHENLVRLLDSGHDGNVHFMVSEYIGGGDLRGLIRSRGRLSLETAASIISQVARGLHYAHEQGVIHRDVKPANILLSEDHQAKLSDLGLIGYLGPLSKEDPEYGKIVGTADYIAPDQILAPNLPSPFWDIYSLGCTLYHAVTGTVPYPGGTTAQKLKAHLQSSPPDPRDFNQYLPPEFVAALQRMMERDPEKRYSSAKEVGQAFSSWTMAPSQLDLSFDHFPTPLDEETEPGERTTPFNDFAERLNPPMPNSQTERQESESWLRRLFRKWIPPFSTAELPSAGSIEKWRKMEPFSSSLGTETFTRIPIEAPQEETQTTEESRPVMVRLPGNPDPIEVLPPPVVRHDRRTNSPASSVSMEIELSKNEPVAPEQISRLRILAWLIFLLGVVPVGTTLFLLAFWRFFTEFLR